MAAIGTQIGSFGVMIRADIRATDSQHITGLPLPILGETSPVTNSRECKGECCSRST